MTVTQQRALIIVATILVLTMLGITFYPAWNRWNSLAKLSAHYDIPSTYLDPPTSITVFNSFPVIGIERGWMRRNLGDKFVPIIAPGDRLIAVGLLRQTHTPHHPDAVQFLSRFSELELLYLDGIQLRGQSSSLKEFSNLKQLCISDSELTDTEAGVLFQLPAIVNLDLLGCKHLTLNLDPTFTPSQTIQGLGLNGIQCDDSAIPTINKFTNLNFLVLAETQITSEGIQSLYLPSLETLFLSHQPIYGRALETLADSRLKFLLLEHTRIQDDDLAVLPRFSHLTTLALHNTDITAKGIFYLIENCKLDLLRDYITTCSSEGLLRLLPNSKVKTIKVKIDDVNLMRANIEKLKSLGWTVTVEDHGGAHLERTAIPDTE